VVVRVTEGAVTNPKVERISAKGASGRLPPLMKGNREDLVTVEDLSVSREVGRVLVVLPSSFLTEALLTTVPLMAKGIEGMPDVISTWLW